MSWKMNQIDAIVNTRSHISWTLLNILKTFGAPWFYYDKANQRTSLFLVACPITAKCAAVRLLLFLFFILLIEKMQCTIFLSTYWGKYTRNNAIGRGCIILDIDFANKLETDSDVWFTS